MKKLIMALALLLLVLVLGGPIFGGIKTRQTLDELVQHIDASPGYSAKWQDYERGWLVSHAALEVELEHPMQASGPATLPLHFLINHGPLLIKDGFKVGWFSGRMQLGSEIEGWVKERVTARTDAPIWETNFKMHLNGLITSSDRSQGFGLTLDDLQITVAAYEGRGELTPGGELKYSGVLPELRLQGNGADLSVEQLAVSAELDFGQKYGAVVVPGTGRLSIGALAGTGPADETLQARGLVVSSSTALNPERTLADIALEFSLDSVVAAGEAVEDIVFVSKFERVSLAFIQQYIEAMEQLDSHGADPVAFDILGPVMTELLPNAPRLRVDPLSFKTLRGAMDLNLSVEVDPAAAKTGNPFGLIQHITVHSQVLVDKDLALKLLEQQTRKDLLARQFEAGQPISEEAIEKTAREQAQFKLNLMIVQRMLVEDQGKYKAEFNFAKGQALLNGQAIPLPF